MSKVSGHPRTKEERKKDHQEWVSRHFLEDGKRYTLEFKEGRGFNREDGWTVYVKQADIPYFIIASQKGFKNQRKAEKWGKEYLQRGGPPLGYFDVPEDPNIITYRKS